MSSEIVKSPQQRALERLGAPDRKIYQDYIDSGKPGLATSFSARLYELWLQGSTIEQIVELNPGLNKGAVMRARVEGLWDERRETYLAELMSNAQDRVKLVALESVNFMGLLLAVANKQHGEKLRRYLQTGDSAELGNFDIQSIKQYKEVVEMLTKITGQDKKAAPGAGGSVSVSVTPGVDPTSPATVSVRWTPEQADQIRAIMESKDGDK